MKWKVLRELWSEFSLPLSHHLLMLHTYQCVKCYHIYVCCHSNTRNQRRATKQEALELDEEMESRLNAANANLKIQVHPNTDQ